MGAEEEGELDGPWKGWVYGESETNLKAVWVADESYIGANTAGVMRMTVGRTNITGGGLTLESRSQSGGKEAAGSCARWDSPLRR